MAIKLIISRRGVPVGERTFAQEIVTLGSDASATLCLADAGVAPEQAIILDEGGQLLLINRADGTLLGGETLAREARRPLAPGDTLTSGPDDIALAAPDDAREQRAADTAPPRPEPPRESAGPQQPSADAPLRVAEEPRPAADSPRSFASILDSLRTEEDSFYFQIESEGGARTRVPVGDAEMMIGWDETGRRISCEAAHVVAPRAVARKDWSGVVVLPLSPGTVSVNGEAVEAPRRLRNGDRLTLLPTPAAGTPDTVRTHIVFHEPTSLVVLDTLLPQQLPPPVSPAQSDDSPAVTAPVLAAVATAEAARGRAGAAASRRYFGYFTLTEVLIMIAGTLVTAVIIFLILEYS
jgi:hypothetical protein